MDTYEENNAIDIENTGSSLPSVDEVKNNAVLAEQKEQRATFVWGCLGIFLMIAIIGTLAGIIADQNETIDSHNSKVAKAGGNFYNKDEIFENGRHSDLSAVQTYLSLNSVSNVADLNDETSHQYQAANWLANLDEADLHVPTNIGIDEDAGYEYMVRYVMALNYFALNGPNWSRNGDFMSDRNVCEWNDASTVEGLDTAPGIFCKNGVPDALRFDDHNLQGHIPTENGLLTSLTQFRMSDNKLASTIPSELCGLTNLSELSFQKNQLEGSIPDCLDKIGSNLKRLELGENALVGPIPPTLGNLNQLEYLDVSHNELSGTPEQTWNGMQLLKTLLAGSNRFEGELSLSFLQTLQKLQHLDLSFNQFRLLNGQFPAHFFNGLTSLEILNLSDNEMKGVIADNINTNYKLKLVSLYQNKLSGPMPASLSMLQAITHLDLSENEFDGQLPVALGYTPSLKFLSLGGNPYLDSAPVPDTYSQLSDLEYLNLGNTNRNGPMPEFIATMAGLQYLDLSRNKFEGDLPLGYFQLSNIEVMLLNGNPQVGAVLGDDTAASLDNAVAIFLDDMNVSGNLNQLCPSEQGTEMVFADCGGDDPAVLCDCCECCPPGNFGCSQDSVAELNEATANAYRSNDVMFFEDSTTDAFMNPSTLP